VIGGTIKKKEVVIFKCSKKILGTADFVTSVLNCESLNVKSPVLIFLSISQQVSRTLQEADIW
jgi:hypothetical protein